jgi:hypothetical protein
MIEKILGAAFFIGFFIKDILGYHKFDQGILMAGLLLGILYLVGYWWINKPAEKTPRTICITILYGISFSTLVFALLFKFLFLTGSDQMTILGLILIVVTISLDFITSIKKARILNAKTTVRLFILLPALAILFFVSEDTRIRFTYRRNQDFIKFYEDNKEKYPTFFDLQESYRNDR